jgi:hypothetical protein
MCCAKIMGNNAHEVANLSFVFYVHHYVYQPKASSCPSSNQQNEQSCMGEFEAHLDH